MSYKIFYPDSYPKRAAKFLKKHPEIHNQYQESLELLEINPFHPSLRLYQLQGRLVGISSISINMSYCIILEFIIQDSEIILVDIENHDQIY